MIGVMEKQGKYSVTTFESFKNALKGSYGDMSLKWNAALAMFLSAPPDEQEVWIQRLIVAKRTAGSKTTLERVRELAPGSPTDQPTSTRAEQILNQANQLLQDRKNQEQPPSKGKNRRSAG